jgi:hypothetical protein
MDNFINLWKDNEDCITWMDWIIDQIFNVYNIYEYELPRIFYINKYDEILSKVYQQKILANKFTYHNKTFEIPKFFNE